MQNNVLLQRHTSEPYPVKVDPGIQYIFTYFFPEFFIRRQKKYSGSIVWCMLQCLRSLSH